MRLILALAALCIVVVSAVPPKEKFFFLDVGELCLVGTQCKSGCCKRENQIGARRCAALSSETQLCQYDGIRDVYYECPCESGLKCDVDRTIGGIIVTNDIGVCIDPNDP
ncbi:colipase B-like [Petromyzon marinus]|uniref:Colipase B-like n=1 Tax=Petromyzon marinus TaxID=7757 RepID=A0AAJ7WWS0_PETMA|nr:colipase B-like [Petromyzon marinus]